MIIKFYDCNDDPRNMPKNPQNETTVTGTIRGEVDKIRPVVEIAAQNVTKNYAYIPDFGRYYYIDSVRILRTGICIVSMRCDVLNTYKDSIMQAPIIAERSANAYNTFIADGDRKFYQYTVNQYIDIGDVGKPDTPILVTVG